MREPVWIPRVAIEAMHADQIREHGGLSGLRDEYVLEAALARPKHQWSYDKDADAASLAAAYGFGIVRNHPFNDGNKRIGFLAMVVFLGLNGIRFTVEPADAVSHFVRLAGGQCTEDELADWIRDNSAAH